MKNRHHRPSIPALPLTTKLGHATLDSKDGFHSGGSRQHDHLWINGLQLQVKPGPAGGQLSFFWSSVVRGAAFDRIADVKVMLGIQIYVPQQLIESTSPVAESLQAMGSHSGIQALLAGVPKGNRLKICLLYTSPSPRD